MVEFDYKQPETERKQNESQMDVTTIYCTHFGRVSGQFILLKHNFMTQQKET
jgi:cellobiose-specific phosphotransferase system component IIB